MVDRSICLAKSVAGRTHQPLPCHGLDLSPSLGVSRRGGNAELWPALVADQIHKLLCKEKSNNSKVKAALDLNFVIGLVDVPSSGMGGWVHKLDTQCVSPYTRARMLTL